MSLINHSDFRNEYSLLQLSDHWEQVPTLVSRVYSAFLTSSHFFRFICNESSLFLKLRFNQIMQYYQDKSMRRLNKFYQCIEDYSNSVPNPDFTIFFPFHRDISFDEWKSNLLNSSLYQQVKSIAQTIANDSIKHKAINDLNGMLISSLNNY